MAVLLYGIDLDHVDPERSAEAIAEVLEAYLADIRQAIASGQMGLKDMEVLQVNTSAGPATLRYRIETGSAPEKAQPLGPVEFQAFLGGLDLPIRADADAALQPEHALTR